MAQTNFNVGAIANDGTGDALRDAFIAQQAMNTDLYTNKVDKVVGKGLSENDFTTILKDKLDNLNANAEENIQADWLQDDDTADDYIKNKPDQLFASVGHFHYNDLATHTTPLVVLPSVPKKLTNDTLGIGTEKDFAPYGVADVWETTDNAFTFSPLDLGDQAQIRFDFLLSSTSPSQKFTLYIKFGVGSPSEYDMLVSSWVEKDVITYGQIIRELSFSIDNEDWLFNPAEIYILSDDDASVKVNGWYVPIIRKSVNVIDFNSDPLKLDKVSTSGVERAYIINADGSQGTKATSEIGGGKEHAFNTKLSQSFGDSITVGQNSTGDNSYIKLISSLYDTTNTNRAVSGRGIWESLRLHNANINPLTRAFSVVMTGFNDVRRGGNSAKTFSKIENGYKGIIVNQFMRTSIAGNTASTSIVRSGTWNQYYSDTVGGKYNNGSWSTISGNYIEYSFSNNNVVIGMICGDGVSEVYGDFDVYIDGVLYDSYTLNNKTDGISDGVNNNQRAPYILYFTGLEDGNHTIRITLTNSFPVPIDYFGHLNDPNLCTPILLMEAPKMNSTGYAIAPANANDTIIDELNVLINSIANEFSNDFPIIVAKTNDYYDLATGLDSDNIHPNDLGHRQIYQSAYEVLRDFMFIRIPETTDLLPSNNTWSGNNDYTKRIKTSSGFQATGALASPTGVGMEIEYNASEGYVTSYNRGLSSWINMVIRGAILKFFSGGTQRMEVNTNGLKLNTLPTYADDAAAGVAGLAAGQLYKTATGEVRVKL